MASAPPRDVEKGEKGGELNAEGCRPEGRGEVRLNVGAGLWRVDRRERRRGAKQKGFHESECGLNWREKHRWSRREEMV